MRSLALGLGLCVLLVGARALGDRPRSDKVVAVPSFGAPEALAIFGPEVAHAVAEALGQAGVELGEGGLRVDGKIEAIDAEHVRITAAIAGHSVEAEGDLEWIDSVAADLASRLVVIVPATAKKALAHAPPPRVDPPWRKAAIAKTPPRVDPAANPPPAGDPSAPPTTTTLPAPPAPPDLAVTSPPAPPAQKDPDRTPPPVIEPKPPTETALPDTTTVTVTPPTGVPITPPSSPPIEPARQPDPYQPLTPPPTTRPSPIIPPPSAPPRTPAVALPLPPAAPLAARPPRVVLHTVHTPDGCEAGEPATLAAREVLGHSGLTDVVRGSCGITALGAVVAEARRSTAASVVMADVEWLRVEGAVFGYRAFGLVRIVAVRDGQPVISTSYQLESRILTSSDRARGAAELTQLAFQRLGRTFTALLASR